MPGSEQIAVSSFAIHMRMRTVALMRALLVATTVLAALAAQAQTFTVLHNFAQAPDGTLPLPGPLVSDRAGNLYGVTASDGYAGGNCAPFGCGTVFELQNRHTGWLFSSLYLFKGSPDGQSPQGVVLAGDGSLYGTTGEGGTFGQGVVFQIRPPLGVCASITCPWDETVLYRFTGGTGINPRNGDLAFDAQGNIYGTTYQGGTHNYGTVYELTRSGGGWTANTLYNFDGNGPNGWGNPYSGVIFDRSGNLYGTTASGTPSQQGVAYELTPSGSGWTANVLHAFQCSAEGCPPFGGLIFDIAGNLYGGTATGGSDGGGTVYELLASQGWSLNLLFSFVGQFAGGPIDSLTMDAAGNLYGTTNAEGAFLRGNVFKLTPSGGGWIYTDLHDFTGGSDGGYPSYGVALDASGDIYGTTSVGGDLSQCFLQETRGCGVLWEIKP